MCCELAQVSPRMQQMSAFVWKEIDTGEDLVCLLPGIMSLWKRAKALRDWRQTFQTGRILNLVGQGLI